MLGAFEVRLDGRLIERQAWQHGSAQRLMKLLLITPRHRLRREMAAETLWPGAPAGRAAANLRRAAHFLGHALGSPRGRDVLLHEPAVIGLSTELVLEVDVDQLQQALDRLEAMMLVRFDQRDDAWVRVLARGARTLAHDGRAELLPDDPYEEWLAPARERLTMRWEELLLAAAQALHEQGCHSDAASIVRHILEHDPADEDAHRLAILLHARRGRLYSARRQFQLCQRMLRDYGLDPSPATIEALGTELPQASVRQLMES